ncbi:hypothetical protein LTS18_003213 [Coniosporium uncinatum]|uniref:Uncharacterized protein n=1 Tax=Coniosporium uncinatum TaxID=93489 RepID=A0ACC3DYH3_9PEZI|nr:hypothetical protein LTS18_003213 [Coniosporium uncinatum]
MVDLTLIQAKWKAMWEQWACVQIILERRDGESHEEFQERGRRVSQLVRSGQCDRVNRGDIDLVERSGQTPHEQTEFGATVTRFMSTARLEEDESAQWLVGTILYEILEYLVSIRKPAVANAIWHSIRMDCMRPGRGSEFIWEHSNWDALPDDVTELLRNKRLTDRRWLTLQLDHDDQNTLNRIMNDGIIWAGSYSVLSFRNKDSDSATQTPGPNEGGSRGEPGPRDESGLGDGPGPSEEPDPFERQKQDG